ILRPKQICCSRWVYAAMEQAVWGSLAPDLGSLRLIRDEMVLPDFTAKCFVVDAQGSRRLDAIPSGFAQGFHEQRPFRIFARLIGGIFERTHGRFHCMQ